MKRLLIFVFIVCLLASAGLAKTYYIPHVAGSSAWTTVLVFNHTGGFDPAKAHMELYDADGSIIATLVVNLESGQTREYRLRDYGAVAGKVVCPSDMVSVRLGFVASEGSGGGTAEFNLPSELTKSSALNLSGYYDQLTWSGYALFNGSDETVTVTPRYCRTDGSSHWGTAFTLDANCKQVEYFADLFGVDFTNIASVVFETDTDALTAIIISGKENEKLLFTRSDEVADSWEVVDRFSAPGMMYSFHQVGQTDTPEYVVYAISSSAGFDFNNLVRCYDKTNGELVWETDVDSEMDSFGIAAAGSGNYIYLYGGIITGSTINWYVYCLNAHTGAVVNWTAYGYGGAFAYEENFKYQIHVASTGETVLVVYQTPAGVTRRLYDEALGTEIGVNTWSGMDTVVTDLGTYSGTYYLLRSDFNDVEGIYNHLMLYMFPSTNLAAGGGMGQAIENPRYDGVNTHVFGDGLYIKGDDVYLALKVLIGNPYGGTMGYLRNSAADVMPSRFDLSTHTFDLGAWEIDRTSLMGAYCSTFNGPDDKIYMGVSGWYRSAILQADYAPSRGYDYWFNGISCAGESLYMVSWHYETDVSDGERTVHVVKVRKIPFMEFFGKGLQ